MATATRKTAGALDSAATNGGSKLPVGALTIEVYQENSGRHSWHLTNGDGRNLATSCESFASQEDAEQSAGEVRRLSAVAARG
jgi:hypothetical protein